MTTIFANGVRFEEHLDHDGAQAIIMRRADGSIFCAAIPGAALSNEEGQYLVNLLNKGLEADRDRRGEGRAAGVTAARTFDSLEDADAHEFPLHAVIGVRSHSAGMLFYRLMEAENGERFWRLADEPDAQA